jgi:hypothetical protein
MTKELQMSNPQPIDPGSEQPRSSRLLRLFKQRGAGDVITAEVGEGGRGVVVGKNIVQIGTLAVPTWALLALLGVIMVGVGLLGWLAFHKAKGPTSMSGLFTVAVANFGEVDANGQVRPSQKGDLLSRRLYEGLQIEFNSLPKNIQQDFQPQVWQDSIDPSQKGVKIGVIPGNTAPEQEAAACALAARINARMVIYGNLPPPGSVTEFIPQVAVCNNSQLRIDADEIVGQHQLSSGIPATLLAALSQPNVETSINIKLNTWSDTFSAFTIGVMYDLQGRSDLALKVFQQAQDEFKTNTGKENEVLWFFIGREHLLLNQDSDAEKAFQQALSVNNQYARAHLGLGTVYKDGAEALEPSQRGTTPDLQNAIEQYQQALQGAAASPGALVDVKANLGLATTFLLKGEMQRDQGNPSGAEDSFNSALHLAQAAQVPLADSQEIRSLAQAYLTEGQAYHELAQLKLTAGDNSASQDFFRQAIAAYEQCKAQQAAAPADTVLGDQVVGQLCIPYQKDAQEALKKLQGGSQ